MTDTIETAEQFSDRIVIEQPHDAVALAANVAQRDAAIRADERARAIAWAAAELRNKASEDKAQAAQTDQRKHPGKAWAERSYWFLQAANLIESKGGGDG